MPDHLHLLVSTEDDSNDLVRFVKAYKQKTGYWFRNRNAAGGLKASPTTANRHAAGGLKASPTTASLWQRSYHDHVLRRDEDVEQVVGYIMDNPVRAGLVETFNAFPHCWSAFAPS